MFERKKDILESILDAVEGHMMKRNKSYVEVWFLSEYFYYFYIMWFFKIIFIIYLLLDVESLDFLNS